MGTLLHCLPALCLLASASPTQPLDELAEVREAYASGLQALSDRCAEANLLNDAERLLLEAGSWRSSEGPLTERKAALRERRIALVQSSERDAYRAFLKSSDCARELEKLEREELSLREETVRELLELVRRGLSDEREQAAALALDSAFALDPDNDKLRRVAGKERLERLLKKRERNHSLSRMTLGETLEGPQVSLADFEGKVVLWRSASL